MTTNQDLQFSIWLLPVAEQMALLQNLINKLAVEFGGQNFVPHMTVQGDLPGPVQKYRPLLAELREEIASMQPASAGQDIRALTPALAPDDAALTWHHDTVGFSDFTFRACFLEFGKDATQGSRFERLRSAARRFTQSEVGMSPFPHLSLLYVAELSDPAKDLVRQRIGRELGNTGIAFGSIALARSSKFIPVADWELLEEIAL